ncbi:rho guanine nucleotide exchange factor 33 isoform X2 [Synchiropus splendidus]|uniref:rho guanine nucleotide exchange factor 33 isoform X2 n=1 Tax=Synchiropus splendidus TaxID=270530 RepID=UPI00237EA9DD|nr:rho guanine nucleotide exchange factor 33 isoform X2 [Synchiropus splendidus]
MEDERAERGDQSEGPEEPEEQTPMDLTELQGLVTELRRGLHSALLELCQLRQRDQSLEEKLQAHQTDVDDKIMGVKNSLNTFKEELSVACFHIKEVSHHQRELIKKVEVLHADRDFPTQHRKSSRVEALAALGEEHVSVPSQSELSVIQHYFSSLAHSSSPQRSNTSTQTSTSEVEGQQRPSRHCSRDEADSPNQLNENSEIGSFLSWLRDTPPHSDHLGADKRQRAALELLESERVYVSHLSLLLKANISFNGSEALASKDKRPFPSSLRFLIQQHLELLHNLQERVLKCQWQGLMGDIFMRLTSKESDFLDFYVSYLKELPECLSVVTMLVSNPRSPSLLLESDITGDECKPSLHMLLLQPVQRIPEYLLLLQGLLRQTDADHPDYYLLLVCIQQFRSFTAQHHHLLQSNQELLLQNQKDVKRSSTAPQWCPLGSNLSCFRPSCRSTMKQLLKTVESGIQSNHTGSPYPHSMLDHSNHIKQSKQRLLEQMQSHRYQNWEEDSNTSNYEREWHSNTPYFSPDTDSRNHQLTGLGSIPEASERPTPCQHHQSSRAAGFRQAQPGSAQPGSALADALGEFLLPAEQPRMENLYEEERVSLPDASLFDRCSSASSDSSIDIAFVKCPKAPMHHALVTPVQTSRDIFNLNGSHGYNKLPNRGCVSPDEAIMMRRNQHRPLQASQRKSKSLNGLQMDATMSGTEEKPSGHAKLERQGSRGSRGCSTPSRLLHSPQGSRVEPDKQLEHHRLLSMEPGLQSWAEDSKWRGGAEDSNPSAFSERSRKQDKGGFRSSFKKLFKKKTGEEKKEKGGEKVQENGDQEGGKNGKHVHLEINRGTAV